MLVRSALGFLSAGCFAICAFAAQAAVLSAPGGGAIHALVVGVNDYPNLGGSSLRGARPDAEDLAGVLRKDGVQDVTVLIDREVTRAAFVAQMNRLVAESRSGDLVFISYSGHGMQVPEYARWKGLDPKGVNEQIALSGFSFKGVGAREVVVNVEVRAWLSRLDAKGVDTVVVWDSCFGGGMRGAAPFGGEIKVRQVTGRVEDEAGNAFSGIDMTAAEARAEVKTMSHVTFLAGSTASSVVPEMDHVDAKNPAQPRGALSYYVARALEGRVKQNGEVSRADLFPFLKQNVSQATKDRQAIQVYPQSEDPSVSHRTVFVVASNDHQDAAEQPISIAIRNGNADSFASIVKGATPIVASDDPLHADLVWDVAAGQAFSQGDMLMEGIDGSMIGAIADRVRAVGQLRAIGEGRPLIVRREPPGALLTPGERETKVVVEGLQGAHLVVFDIAADATVLMYQPAPEGASAPCHEPRGPVWTCGLDVEAPFGVDTLFALTSNRDTSGLLTWLRQHHGKRDAAQLPDLIRGLLAEDSTARVGFVAITTRAKAY